MQQTADPSAALAWLRFGRDVKMRIRVRGPKCNPCGPRSEVRGLESEVRSAPLPTLLQIGEHLPRDLFQGLEHSGALEGHASIVGSFLRRSCLDSASTGSTFGRSRLFSCST